MCYLDPWDSCVFGEGWMVDDGEIRDGVMVLWCWFLKLEG